MQLSCGVSNNLIFLCLHNIFIACAESSLPLEASVCFHVVGGWNPQSFCFSCSAPGALCPCSGLGSDVPRTVSSWVPELFQGSTGKIGFLLPGPRLPTLGLHFSLLSSSTPSSSFHLHFLRLGKIELSFIEDGFGFFCFLLGGRKGGGVVFFLPSLVTGG